MAGEHKHPNYMAIFWTLAILTVVELGVVFLPFGKFANGTMLCALALAKAAIVAAYFMHLRFETRTLGAHRHHAAGDRDPAGVRPHARHLRGESQDRRQEAGRRGPGEALTGTRDRSGACSMAAEAVLTRIIQAERRALQLTCPRCGRAPLFRGWFRMNVVCAVCDLRFERAQGYWVGAIYVNYGVTVAIAVGGFFLLRTVAGTGDRRAAGAVGAVRDGVPAVVLPLQPGLWLGLEYGLNPDEG